MADRTLKEISVEISSISSIWWWLRHFSAAPAEPESEDYANTGRKLQILCDFQCIVFAFAHMYLAFLPTHQAETSFLCIIVFNSANWLTAYMRYTVIIPSRRCIDPQQNKCENLFLVIVCNTCCHSVCVSEAATICNEFLDAALHISLQRDVQARNSWISTKSHKASLAMSPRAWGVEPSALLGASISRNAD